MLSNIIYFTLFPLVGALLGWFTNYLAVKMLFHPKEPRTVLCLGWGKWKTAGITFQGIFPKRQRMMATKIGKVVAEELLSVSDIKERVVTDDSMAQMLEQVKQKMDDYLEHKIPKKFPLLSMLATKKLKYDIRDHMLEEVEAQLPDMMDKYLHQMEAQLDIEEMITEKFSQLSTERLEEVMNEILSKEFQFIERLGGVIGFVVGLVQAGIAAVL